MEEHSKPAIMFSCLNVNFVVVSLALVLVLVPFLDALCFRIIGIAEQIKFLSRKGFLRKILVCIIGRIVTVHGSRPNFPATQARPCQPCLTSVLSPTYIEESRQKRVLGCMTFLHPSFFKIWREHHEVAESQPPTVIVTPIVTRIVFEFTIPS